MAYITEFNESKSPASARPHSTCSCGWKIADREGSKVLQLDTYGSPERKDQGTVSQSLQLDRDRAAELIQILRSTFPGL